MVDRFTRTTLSYITRQLTILDDKITVLSRYLQTPHTIAVLRVGTALTLQTLKDVNKPVTASEVAHLTHRSRNIECTHLNDMAREGIVKVHKEGRTKFYRLEPSYRSLSNDK